MDLNVLQCIRFELVVKNLKKYEKFYFYFWRSA
jgi:hypothetical protein